MKVFVYGTLLKGERNHQYYLEGAKYIGDGKITGYDMYDLGTYPAITEGKNTIVGEVYEINENELKELDCLEGYRPSNNNSLYLRKEVAVSLDNNESVTAYVYYFNKSLEGYKLWEDNKKWFRLRKGA